MNTNNTTFGPAQEPLKLTMEQIIAHAVHTIVVQRDAFEVNQRGIEPTEPDDITLADWTKRMAYKVTRGERIRLGQLSGAFSLAAGRPIKNAMGPYGPVRLHAVSSLKRAVEAMGLPL